MAINLDEVITILNLKQRSSFQLESIMLEYGSLIQKMDNLEQQSWFFKKAEKNNRLKLIELKSQYEKMRNDVNGTDMNNLIESLNDHQADRAFLKKKPYLNFTDRIALASINSNIQYVEELLSVKSRCKLMQSLDHYLEDSEALIKLLGWKELPSLPAELK